jgi:hypothetical protein
LELTNENKIAIDQNQINQLEVEIAKLRDLKRVGEKIGDNDLVTKALADMTRCAKMIDAYNEIIEEYKK